MDLDAAAEEARLGTQGAFNYNRCGAMLCTIRGWLNAAAAPQTNEVCPVAGRSRASGLHAHLRIVSALLPRCRTNPLPADAVLIDEASMLSLPLAAALMDALKPKCQLVLVGDVDQLPPVGEWHRLVPEEAGPRGRGRRDAVAQGQQLS